MVVVLTSDDMANRARKANEERIALLGKEDFNADDKAECERLESLAKDYYERSDLKRTLEKELAQAKDEFVNRPGQQPANNNEQPANEVDKYHGFPTIGQWFKGVYTLRKSQVFDPRLRYWGGEEHHTIVHATDKKTLMSSVGEQGGFLVQPVFEQRVRAVQATMSIVRPRAEIIRMASRTVTLPVLDQTDATPGQGAWFGGMVAFWTEEGANAGESEPRFRQETLTAHNMTAYTVTSQILLDDSAQSLEDFFLSERGFPGVMTWTEDYAFLQGDGVGKPEGFLGSPCRFLVNRQTANAVEYLDLTAMLTHMMPGNNGIWVAHQSVMQSLLEMEGPSGNPQFLWGNAVAGVPNTLLGRPIIFTDKLPFLGTEGDIIYVDWGYYLVGDRQTITIDLSTDEHFRNSLVSWRANERVDGKPWLASPITYQDGTFQVSPIIVLSDVAT